MVEAGPLTRSTNLPSEVIVILPGTEEAERARQP
jgi:hypothetical protein